MKGNIQGLNATLHNNVDSALKSFNQLDKQKKGLLISGVVLFMVVVIALMVWAGNPRYVSLYTNLTTQDAASITQYLKEKKVPYQIGDGGSAILVPESQKYQIRLDLASNNLPKGNIVGFESFDQTHFGETDSEQRVRYLVALQGELERTISKIDGVDDVRVHIMEPQPTLFVEDKKDATAAVMLKLKAGYNLQDPQVLGITRLVASGVEGLKPDNVSVIDSAGNVLSDNINSGSQSGGTLTSSQLQIKDNYEKLLQKSIQSMLDRVVGSGKAVVRVNATFSFDQLDINKENYGDRQVQSNHTTDETTNSGGSGQGQPGSTSNITTYAQSGGLSGGQTQQKTDNTTTYVIDKQIEHRIVAPGQVKQLSLSVVLSDKSDSQRQQDIKDMVISAAGIQTNRGDNVSVACIPFNTAATDQVQQQMDAQRKQSQIVTILTILAALILAGLVIWYLRRQYSQHRQDAPELLGQGISVGEMLVAKQQELDLSISKENEQKSQVLEQLRKMAQENPGETLDVLRSWLANEPND